MAQQRHLTHPQQTTPYLLPTAHTHTPYHSRITMTTSDLTCPRGPTYLQLLKNGTPRGTKEISLEIRQKSWCLAASGVRLRLFDSLGDTRVDLIACDLAVWRIVIPLFLWLCPSTFPFGVLLTAPQPFRQQDRRCMTGAIVQSSFFVFVVNSDVWQCVPFSIATSYHLPYQYQCSRLPHRRGRASHKHTILRLTTCVRIALTQHCFNKSYPRSQPCPSSRLLAFDSLSTPQIARCISDMFHCFWKLSLYLVRLLKPARACPMLLRHAFSRIWLEA
ncbi:hypothetical protein BDV96DRAFT_28396 [Lophiotrema nucula]|uniref:Uncharacterized protein n=1 Tax=Lophiotrema nucula TaxID=690887 RepID=A0A6A5ZBW6_9PLEO|nr:hypothetical protein BDV96DRAFT_28396 [Lophiotrema nucula]